MTTPGRSQSWTMQTPDHGNDAPPPYGAGLSPPALFTKGPNELKLWPASGPLTTAPSLNAKKHGRRGRPPVEVNVQDERRLVRLFTSAPANIEQITEAIANLNGPGRLWLRDRFKKLIGLDSESRWGLKDLRQHRSGAAASTARNRRTSECFMSSPENHNESQNGRQAPKRVKTVHHNESPSDITVTQPLEQDTRNSCRRDDDPMITRLQNPGPMVHSLEARSIVAWESASNDNSGLGESSVSDEAPHDQDAGGTPSAIHANLHVSPKDEEAFKFDAEVGCSSLPRKKFIRWTKVALALDDGRYGLHSRLIKDRSISKSTIASWLCSRSSQCNIRTEDSEFSRYYSHLVPFSALSESAKTSSPGAQQGIVPFGGPSATQPLVIECILRARASPSYEDDIIAELRTRFSETDQAGIKDLVNTADIHGVTGLHLAVALGYCRICAFLMENGADPEARTQEDTCIDHFAMPAERFFGRKGEVQRYCRVRHCRIHVRQGLPPPDPQLKGRSRKRGRTTPGATKTGNAASPLSSDSPLSGKSRRSSAIAMHPDPRARCISNSPVGSVETLAPRNLFPEFAEAYTDSPRNTLYGEGAPTSHVQDFASRLHGSLGRAHARGPTPLAEASPAAHMAGNPDDSLLFQQAEHHTGHATPPHYAHQADFDSIPPSQQQPLADEQFISHSTSYGNNALADMDAGGRDLTLLHPYFECVHGHPRNFLKSYCNFCPMFTVEDLD